MRSNRCHQATSAARPKITLHRRTRGALLLGTALQAAALLVVELPAKAQPAPGTHPTGGSVVAGQASISNNGATTLINQASQSASINWQSFSVAADQSVVFHQPGSRSIALNRVIGPDPSVIAGRITANGQIVLINQSGVLFTRGSQVDTAGLVVSAAGMSNKNFAAGKLVFDQAAHPGATVSNAGNITIRQAGLAALVAPQVANSGLITAKLGHVVLAGVQTATLDLYGDRLISLNVTGAVTSVSIGGQVIPALVTNTGTILAPGGTITLTARDADALVSQLVTAGGLISTNNAGARGGQILVDGVGGSVEISGTLTAQGTGATSKGGAVQVAATGNVVLDSGATVNASGTRGGGTVALGTRLARARHGSGVSKHAASRVLIAQGATVRADATLSGAGGRIAVLGQQSVTQAGALSARGAGTGNGGSIELSTNGALAITGTENAGAAGGHAGSITIDPPNVEITNGAPDPGYTAISTATIDGMTGDVIILAGDTLRLLSAVVLGPGATGFALTAGRDLVLDASFDAGSLAGSFSAGAGGIQQTAGQVTAGSLDIQTTGALTQSGTGVMALGTLSGAAAGIILTGPNGIGALGPLASTGGVDITTTSPLQIDGALDAHSNAVTLTGASVDLTSPVTATTLDLIATAGDITQTKAGVIDAGTLTASAVAGNGLAGQILLDTAANTVSMLGSVSAASNIVFDDDVTLLVDGPVRSQSAAVTLNETGYFQDLDIAGPVTAATTLDLIATHDIAIGGTLSAAAAVLSATDGAITESGGAILLGAGTLNAQAASGITLDATANSLGNLGTSNAGDGAFVLADSAALTVAGRVKSDGNLTLDIGGAGHDLTLAAVLASDTVTLNVTGGGVGEQAGGGITTGTLSASAANALSLTSALNQVGTLAALSAGGDIDFAQSGGVKLTGDVTAGGTASLTGSSVTQFAGTIASPDTLTITAQSGALVVGGVLSAPTVTLLAATGITETPPGANSPTGAIIATSLTGSAGGTVLLNTPASAAEPNQVGTLSGFSAGQGLALADASALAVTGTISTGGVLAIGAPALTLATTLADPAGTVLLTVGDGGLTGTQGRIEAATLTGTAGGMVTLDGNNTIATLSAFTTGGAFDLTDASALVIAGQLSAPSVTLNTAGPIDERGTGAIATTLLAASTSGSIQLDGANTIGTLATVAAGGQLLVNDAGPLTLDGTITAGAGATLTASGALSQSAGVLDAAGPIDLTAGSIAFSGLIEAPGQVVTLVANDGSIVEAVAGGSAGTLLAGTLTGSATGSLALTTPAGNQIATLAGFTTNGNLALTDSVTPTITGLVSAGQTLALTVAPGAAGTLLLDDTSIKVGELVLTTPGEIVQAGGSITVGTLTAMVGGALDLDGGDNAIVALGAVSTGGDLTLADATGITIAGPVSSARDIILSAVGGITIAGALTDTGGVTTLRATGGDIVSEASAAVTLATLTGSAAGSGGALDLDAGTIHLGTLTNFTAASTIAVADASPLTVAGLVQASGTEAALTASQIDVAGTLALTGSGLISLAADHFVLGGEAVTPGGTIALSRLTAGVFSVGVGDSTVSSLTGLQTGTGRIVIGSRDGSTIDPATTAIAITVPTNLNGGTDSAGTLDLLAEGNIASSAGLAVGVLTAASATGGIAITGPNAISSLGPITAPGSVIVNDTGALAVAANVTGLGGVTLTSIGGLSVDAGATVAGANVSLTADAITLLGTLAAAAGTVTLAAPGAIAEAGGSILAATLAGPASQQDGTLTLLSASNQIGTLGALSSSGDLALRDETGLTIAGPTSVLGQVAIFIDGPGGPSGNGVTATGTLQAAGLSITAPGAVVQTAGLLASGTDVAISAAALDFAGTIRAAGTTTLALGGDLVEASTGALATPELTGTAAGNVSLASAQNTIATIGSLQAGGQVTVADQVALTVAGPLASASAGVALTDTQSLTLDGSLSGGTVALAASGITQASTGSIDAALLTGTAAGDTTLDGANHIAALGPFTTGGTLNLADTGPLSVTGAVSAGGALGMTVQGDLTLLADVSGTGVTLAASGSMDQQAGTVSGTGIALSAASVAQSLAGALVLYDAGKVSLTSSGAIALGGSIDAAQGAVTVSTPSGVTDTGQLAAATLTGTVGGAASFTGAGIAVAQLDGFSAATGLTLADGVDLAIDGPVSGGGIRLSVGGAGTAMTISGTLSSSGVVALASARDISQSAGTITAATTARLDAAGTISLAGELAAPTLLIGSARAPAVLAWNDNTLLTTSVLSHDQLLDFLPPDNGSQPGIYVRAGSLVQTGTTFINPSGGAATLEVVLTGSGKVTLDPLQTEGLLARSTFAFFDLAEGTASGHLEVSSLFVEYGDTGATNPTKFTGSVDGIAGTSAAAFAEIGPLPNQLYEINGCALGAVDCVLLSPISVPVANPVLEVSFDPPRRRLDDDDLVLPDVAEQDY